MQELKSIRTSYQKCDTEEGITAICNYNPSQFTDALRPSVVLATQMKRSLCFGSSASNSSGLFQLRDLFRAQNLEVLVTKLLISGPTVPISSS